jgi:hypothetical protein
MLTIRRSFWFSMAYELWLHRLEANQRVRYKRIGIKGETTEEALVDPF